MRISSSAPSFDLAKTMGTPSWLAAVLIFDVNIKSSTMARIIRTIATGDQAVGPFFKNGFVIRCEESREAVLIDPGDEVEQLLTFANSMC